MTAYADLDSPQTGGGGFFSHIPAILWQRRWWVIIPLILGIIGSVAAVILIPPTYRSSAMMLVQSPQLSTAVIGADTIEVVDRRIASIAEQITSRPDLVSLIDKYGLYKDVRGKKPLSKILETMRESITLTPTGGDSASNNPNDRTIAFRLTFDYTVPAQAQSVAQDLMQRILELDATDNSEQATRRVEFLTEQSLGLEQQISEIQGRISAINAQNGTILSNSGVTMIGSNSGSYDMQIAALQRDNANLVSQREAARSADTRDPVVAAAESQLAAAQAIYSDNHPDVGVAKQRLAEARQLAKNNTTKMPFDLVDQQISFNNSQIAALRAARAQEMSQVSAARSAQSRAPLVQTQLSQLQQQLSRVNEQYQSVSTKLMAARAGVRADDEQLGERLTVVDPPVVPDTPVWPNRLLILTIGVGGGLGLGLLLALALDLLLQPIRDPEALAALVGSPPLAMIPVIGKRIAEQKTHPRLPSLRWPWSKSQ